jgi:hypothetical protein
MLSTVLPLFLIILLGFVSIRSGAVLMALPASPGGSLHRTLRRPESA